MAKLLPSALASNESFVAIMEIVEERLSEIPIDQGIVNEIDNVDPSALLTLAHQFGAYRFREWLYHYTDEQKRDAIKKSIPARSIDGTSGAIIASGKVFSEEFTFYQGKDEITTRFPDLNPANIFWYNFVVTLGVISSGNKLYELTGKNNFNAAIDSWKNARSEFLWFLIEYDVPIETGLQYVWSDTPIQEHDPDPGEDGFEGDLYISGVFQYTF